VADAGNYAFNDVHAVMAFIGANRPAAVEHVLDAQSQAMAVTDDNAAFVREVGRPVALAMKAFGESRYADAAQLLRGVRNIAHRFGGSHAQRDILDLTLIEAALRGNQHAVAAALAAERAAMRPASPLARLFVQRAAGMARAA
jgi:hypothetical protein